MDVTRLVSMANDIAAFFDAEAGEAGAAANVRAHIARYWDPRMRRELIAHSQAGGAGLVPSALSAARSLAAPAAAAVDRANQST